MLDSQIFIGAGSVTVEANIGGWDIGVTALVHKTMTMAAVQARCPHAVRIMGNGWSGCNPQQGSVGSVVAHRQNNTSNGCSEADSYFKRKKFAERGKRLAISLSV